MGVLMSRRSLLISVGLLASGSFNFPQEAIAQTLDEVVPMVTYDGPSRIVQERSWYSSSFQLNRRYISNTYYYDGNNIGIELNASAVVTGSSFRVTLYQGSRSRGSTTLKSNGFVRAEWNGVGPGSYKFEFVNLSGRIINCTNVAMFSW